MIVLCGLQITLRAVHKMMKEGRLRYVLAAGHRLPIRACMAPAQAVLETAPRPAGSNGVGKRSVTPTIK